MRSQPPGYGNHRRLSQVTWLAPHVTNSRHVRCLERNRCVTCGLLVSSIAAARIFKGIYNWSKISRNSKRRICLPATRRRVQRPAQNLFGCGRCGATPRHRGTCCGHDVFALGVAHAVRGDLDIGAGWAASTICWRVMAVPEGASSLETWWVSLIENCSLRAWPTRRLRRKSFCTPIEKLVP